jgi:hypothetical protein
MVVSISESDDETERRARLAREMVEELQQFLGAAMAGELQDNRQYEWPLRYNPSGAGVVDRHATEE